MCDNNMSSELNGLYKDIHSFAFTSAKFIIQTSHSRKFYLNHYLAKQMLSFSHLVGVKLKRYLVVKKNTKKQNKKQNITRACSNKKVKHIVSMLFLK